MDVRSRLRRQFFIGANQVQQILDQYLINQEPVGVKCHMWTCERCMNKLVCIPSESASSHASDEVGMYEKMDGCQTKRCASSIRVVPRRVIAKLNRTKTERKNATKKRDKEEETQQEKLKSNQANDHPFKAFQTGILHLRFHQLGQVA